MSAGRATRKIAASRGADDIAEPAGHAAVHQQLERILASAAFEHAGGLKRFLTFIVNQAVTGHVTELKEYVIGVQVFRKDPSFDQRTDPIVRVQARRLRAKLVQYYSEEGLADSLVIDLPKGGYAPVFSSREPPAPVKRLVSTALLSRNTIGVLPLADHSAEADLGYFCKGIREEILHRLARVRGLRVFAASGSEVPDHRDAASAGAAALMIGGSVRRSGGRVRISVHLIDGASDCYLWSEGIDADLAEEFAAQEKIADAIVSQLEPGLRDFAGKGLGRPAENLAAKNLYLQGRYHLDQRTDEGLRKAVDFFERALGEDPDYALAHSGLADAYGLLGHYGVLGPADVWTKAASRAASAVLLDDLSAEAHTSLAHVKATQDWDWVGAEREFHRAINLNPGYPTAHHWFAASCLAPQGRLDESLNEMLVAQALDPVSPIVARDLAVIHFYRRDFETALEQCDHTIELNPHFAQAYWILGTIQEQRRVFDEAAAAFQRAVHLSPQTPRMHSALGRTFALSGREDLALEVLRKLEAFAEERYVSPVEFAWMQFALGDIDLGFRWLAKASADRSFDLISLKVDPRFDPLRDDPRFPPLLKQLGLS